MKRALIVVDVQNDFCEGGSLAVSGGATVAWAALGALVPLALPSDDPPGPVLLLAGSGWWALCVALPSIIRRRLPPRTLAARHAEIVTACTVSYLGFSLLVNPFFALLAAGYLIDTVATPRVL